ncbi:MULTISPECIES: acyl carrier protein [unclassified Kitasatospora]|uniref:acyl carrier protein n=1 Tax=unclassified Kitasatospora TaxID=2633591 RepID=UPI00331F9323
MTDTAKDTVRQFVLRHTDGIPVEDGEDLFDAGFVNSLFAVQLVMWIERTFALTVRREELLLDDLRTVDGITAFVRARTTDTRDAAWTSN